MVSIICHFIVLHSDVYQKAQLHSSGLEFSVSRGGGSSFDSSACLMTPPSETKLHWHQKAVVLVMEAGGLNWLVGKVGTLRFCYVLGACWMRYSIMGQDVALLNGDADFIYPFWFLVRFWYLCRILNKVLHLCTTAETLVFLILILPCKLFGGDLILWTPSIYCSLHSSFVCLFVFFFSHSPHSWLICFFSILKSLAFSN